MSAWEHQKMRSWILMQRYDEKSVKLQKALRENWGVDLVPIAKKNSLLPAYLLALSACRRRRPAALVYRYLNDHGSASGTMLLLFSELLSCVIARIMRVPVIWICHNVDRETAVYHPRINAARRSLLKRQARKILVMDPVLVPDAIDELRVPPERVSYITFGLAEQNSPEWRNSELFAQIRAFCAAGGDNSLKRRPLTGLTVGHASWKTRRQFSAMIPLLDAAQSAGHDLKLIVIGPVRSFLEKDAPEVLQALRRDSRVFLYDEYVKTDEKTLSTLVDFYWRVYDDLSVPYTLYRSATVGKPILTMQSGFLGKAVSYYRLGVVVREDLADIKTAVRAISQWDQQNASYFLSSHTWERAAAQLLQFSSLATHSMSDSAPPPKDTHVRD